MFEKEAEERAEEETETIDDCDYDGCSRSCAREYYYFGFKDGAEFGYNKANEWHDLRKNPLDLPTKNCTVLIYTDWQGMELKTFFVDTRLFENLTFREVIAWCEIPKYTEE